MTPTQMVTSKNKVVPIVASVQSETYSTQKEPDHPSVQLTMKLNKLMLTDMTSIVADTDTERHDDQH